MIRLWSKGKSRPSVDSVHLNITPFIDILVCLLLFLLSSAAFLKLAVIDTDLPKLRASASDKQEDKEKFVVTVTVRSSGFEIGASGKVPASAGKKPVGLSRRIPLLSGGGYDLVTLNRHMIALKDQIPSATTVLILPEGNVRFETLVETMDATREAARDEKMKHAPVHLLFPEVVLGQTSEGNS